MPRLRVPPELEKFVVTVEEYNRRVDELAERRAAIDKAIRAAKSSDHPNVGSVAFNLAMLRVEND
jgi:hypothetical protein